jgi:hypothetical protein
LTASDHTFVQWRDIANAQPGSTLYNDVVRWATRIKGLGTHVYFTFNHEPETTQNTSGTGAEFIAAWRMPARHQQPLELARAADQPPFGCSPRARPSRAS